MKPEEVLAHLNVLPNNIDDQAAELVRQYKRLTDIDEKKEFAVEVVDKLFGLTFAFPVELPSETRLHRGRTIESTQDLYANINSLGYNQNASKISHCCPVRMRWYQRISA